jgi:GalNAc-alpha-(1->4)-GalNAc-alpha-(1->3)-diNAcBac-PP-undecaprenol alpha-1,4-N-acetyl-D-galactosaminyltransferase
MSAAPYRAAAVEPDEERVDGRAAGAAAPPDIRRITLVISSLASGGAERVMTTMANHWVAAGREVTLVTVYGESADFFTLDERVRRSSLRLGFATSGAPAAVLSNLRRVRRLRQAILDSSPDAVVSFMSETNVLTLLALRGTGMPVVVSERTDPAHQAIGRMWAILRRLLYPIADAVVVQSPEVREWTGRFVPAERVRVIPNPVAPHPPASGPAAGEAALGEDVGIPAAGTAVLAMGRLSPEKGFDLLIRAFARVAERHPGWVVVIFGEGEERGALEALAAELGVGGRVRLPGRVADPGLYLEQGGVFALPSRYEGFPNALLEAMAAGLAVVAADCPSGPRQIVRDGVDGLLVPPQDPRALAAALEELLTKRELRERLGGEATGVLERFGVGRVMRQWDALLAAAAEGRAERRGRAG